MKLQGETTMAAAVVVVLVSFSIAISAENAVHFLDVSRVGVPSPSPSPSPSPAPAPAPLAPPANITLIIEDAGQFKVLLGLLQSTGAGIQFQSIVNNTQGSGLTIFAPTDAAFATMRRGALNQLSAQQTLTLVQYHALPSFFNLSALQQPASPEFATMVPGSNTNGGYYTVNVTNVQGTVMINTGLVAATLVSTLYDSKPCSIFAIDTLLLPEAIFGLPSPAPAPSPYVAPVQSPSPAASPSAQASAESPSGVHANQAPASMLAGFGVGSVALGLVYAGFYLM